MVLLMPNLALTFPNPGIFCKPQNMPLKVPQSSRIYLRGEAPRLDRLDGLTLDPSNCSRWSSHVRWLRDLAC